MLHKKIGMVFLICMLFMALPAMGYAAETMMLEVDEVIVDGNQATISVPIRIENNPGVACVGFTMEYDKNALELTEITAGSIFGAGEMDGNVARNPFLFTAYTGTSNKNGDGVLVNAVFRLKSNVSDVYAINLSAIEVYDIDLNDVEYDVVNGAVVVNGVAADEDEQDNNNNSNNNNNSSAGSGIVVNKPQQEQKEEAKEDVKPQSTAQAGITKELVLTIDHLYASVDGKLERNDVAPIIRNDRTYTPARYVAEKLGAKVDWDSEKRTITITKGDDVIILIVDSHVATVNGEAVLMPAAAFIENDRTYTPARFVAEQLGAQVEWDGLTRTVHIVPGSNAAK